jgi:hypothetical protein
MFIVRLPHVPLGLTVPLAQKLGEVSDCSLIQTYDIERPVTTLVSVSFASSQVL